MDLPYFIGFRFCRGILDMDSVSMMTNVNIVRLERTSAFRTSPGKNPQKFVIRATTIAAIIMNALLLSRSFAVMYAAWDNAYKNYRLSINNE